MLTHAQRRCAIDVASLSHCACIRKVIVLEGIPHGLVGPLLSSNLCIVLCLVFLVSFMFHCFHACPAGWGRLPLSPSWGLFPLSAKCLMLCLIFLSPEIHLPVRHLGTWFFLVGARIQWSSRPVEGCYTSARSR